MCCFVLRCESLLARAEIARSLVDRLSVTGDSELRQAHHACDAPIDR
jgi:hypothetical protein